MNAFLPYVKHTSILVSIMLAVTGIHQLMSDQLYLGLALIFFALLILFYLFCALFSLRIPKTVKLLRIIVSVIFLSGFTYFCVVESFIIKDAQTEMTSKPDFIIVLGANVNGSSPSPALADRLQRACEYMNEHPDCTAILTGGNETGQDITEAECMFQWMIENGISENRLIVEPYATSTEENILYSIKIINHMSDEPVIGLLTSDYHLHRAKYLASSQGLDVVGISARTSSPATALNNFIREVFGMTYYYVFGVEAT